MGKKMINLPTFLDLILPMISIQTQIQAIASLLMSVIYKHILSILTLITILYLLALRQYLTRSGLGGMQIREKYFDSVLHLSH